MDLHPAHSNCWQNSVPCGFCTEILISLLAVSYRHFSASRERYLRDLTHDSPPAPAKLTVAGAVLLRPHMSLTSLSASALFCLPLFILRAPVEVTEVT